MDTQQPLGWRFWAGWGLAFVGFPLGGVVAQALTGGVATPAEGLLAGAATGAVVRAAQWLVLSRRLPLSPWWVVATSAGMAAGLALSTQLLGTETVGNALPLRGLVTGASIGLAQMLVLRGLTDRAPLWGLVVALGWPLGWLTTRAVGVELAPQFAVFGSTGAWVFQFLTGLTLAWILRQRATPASHRHEARGRNGEGARGTVSARGQKVR